MFGIIQSIHFRVKIKTVAAIRNNRESLVAWLLTSKLGQDQFNVFEYFHVLSLRHYKRQETWEICTGNNYIMKCNSSWETCSSDFNTQLFMSYKLTGDDWNDGFAEDRFLWKITIFVLICLKSGMWLMLWNKMYYYCNQGHNQNLYTKISNI